MGLCCASQQIWVPMAASGPKPEVLFNNHTSAFISSGHATALAQVREVPLPDVSRCSKLSKLLLDHLVGTAEKRQWYTDPEGLGGLKIDEQFNLGALKDRQRGRFFAFENPASVNPDKPKRFAAVRSIAHQTPGRHKLVALENCRHPVTKCQMSELFTAAVQERIRENDKSVSSPLEQRCEDRIEFAIGTRKQDIKLYCMGTGCSLEFARLVFS